MDPDHENLPEPHTFDGDEIVELIPDVGVVGPLRLTKLVSRLGGARLCYGKPVRAGKRTIVPVASVRFAGGGGFGRGTGGAAGEEGSGGGAGGYLEGMPIGYIEIGPEGARFRRIVTAETVVRTVAQAARAGVTVGAAVAAWRRRDAMRRRRAGPKSPRRWLAP